MLDIHVLVLVLARRPGYPFRSVGIEDWTYNPATRVRTPRSVWLFLSPRLRNFLRITPYSTHKTSCDVIAWECRESRVMTSHDGLWTKFWVEYGVVTQKSLVISGPGNGSVCTQFLLNSLGSTLSISVFPFLHTWWYKSYVKNV